MTDQHVWLLAKVPETARCLEGMPDQDVAYSAIVFDWLRPVLAQFGIDLIDTSEFDNDPGPIESFTDALTGAQR